MPRPRLGIQVAPLTEQLARYFKVEDGILVTEVRPDSPAERAGLRAGDVIVTVDGAAVTSARELQRRVARFGEGELALGLQRDGQPLELKVHLEARAGRRPTT
jgi:S1-C subfamily serine protease